MPEFIDLCELCKERGLPEPKVREKMWGFVVGIPGHYNTYHHDLKVAIASVVAWCHGHLESI